LILKFKGLFNKLLKFSPNIFPLKNSIKKNQIKVLLKLYKAFSKNLSKT